MSKADISSRRAALSETKLALLEKLLRGKSARNADAVSIPRCNRTGPVPVSSAQQRLWFLDQLMPGHPLYIIPAAVRLRGRINAAALEQSVNRIVGRQESLRTRFESLDGRPVQVIEPSLTITIPMIDLNEVSGEYDQGLTSKLGKEEGCRPFSLERAPLFRVTLVRWNNEEHVLLLMMHHIISDEWSIGIMVREIAAFYQACSTGGISFLPDVEIQCADYAAWEQERLKGDLCQKQLYYWKQQLQGAPPGVEVPACRSRPATRTFSGGRLQFVIAQEQAESLKTLGERCGATPFMVVMAAFSALLNRYTGQTDLVIGFPIANRDRSEVDGLIGCFINTLPIRSDLSGDPTFEELLGRVKKASLEAYAHQDVPFEKIVDEMQPARDLSRQPLCNVMFVFQNIVIAALDLPGLSISPVQIHNETAKLDLALSITEVPEGLAGYFEYAKDMFDDGGISRLIGHFKNLVTSIAAAPRRPVSSLAMLGQTERERLIAWSGTESPFTLECPFHIVFESQVERTPHAIAVSFGQRQTTYAELNRRANLVAVRLATMGVVAETIVAICMKSSPEMVISMLGIMKAGAAYLPLDPAQPARRLATMIEDSRAPVLLTQPEVEPELPQCAATVIVLEDEWEQIEPLDDWDRHVDVLTDNLAYVIYTSGSTGKPKGVLIPHRGLTNLVLWHVREFSVTHLDRAAQVAGVAFDAYGWEIWPYLASGASVHIADESIRTSPEELQEWMVSKQITVGFLVTPLAETALMLDWPRESSLRILLTGGDKLRHHPSTRLPFMLANNYGPTENTVVATSGIVEQGPLSTTGPPSIGRPVSSTRAYLLTPEAELAPEGGIGALHLGGASLARGYLFDPLLTAEKFIPDRFSGILGARLYSSGDLARFRSDGAIDFQGRMDQQVKVRGYRVEPSEIEAVLLSYGAVRDAVVVARGAESERRLVAYVVTEEGRSLSMSEMTKYLRSRLPEQMVPAALVRLEAMPMTANGKVDRRALPAPDSEPDRSHSMTPPRNKKEELLTDIWKQVLGLEQIGVHDNFFESGGDSILSIQVITRANRVGLQLASRQIFQHQTIAELAAVAGAARSIEAEQHVVSGAVPLTPVQRWFFAQGFADPHHYNQAVMFEMRQRVKPAILEKAVRSLIDHHDALRLRFTYEGGHWLQTNDESAPSGVFSTVDLSLAPAEESAATIEREASRAQASLDLFGGLVRVVLFEVGEKSPPHLLIVIHHLAVDGVSWRILLEDLESACNQISAGTSARLPAKTTSFKQWAERLAKYSLSANLLEEAGFWLNAERSGAAPMPVDYEHGTNTSGSARSVTVSLEAEQTRALLHDVPPVYHTRINDLLMTALAIAYKRWSGLSRLLISLEGHGREEVFENLDLTRTVGWFTTLFPVLLDLGDALGEGDAIKRIKEQLRSITNRGFAYGVLRYLSSDREVAAQLSELERADVSFNYLGQLDQAVANSALFALSRGPVGPARSPRAARSHLLEVNGWIFDGRLSVEMSFSQNVHRRETIEGFAEGFVGALESLIAHCRSEGAGGHTPSDFPLARIDQASLDNIVSSDGRVEDIYPLSATQQGMLFHSLYEPDSGIYVSQMTCVLRGEMNLNAFRRAWRQVVTRHHVLRTRISLNATGVPLQVVCRDVQFSPDYLDLRDTSNSSQKARIADLLEQDRKTGFDFNRAPLMRVTLIRKRDDAYQLIWSHHHILLDGWSSSALLVELFALYEAWESREPPPVEPARPYRDYIEWAQRQDKRIAEAYWRGLLRGYRTPIRLGIERPSTSEDEREPGYAEARLILSEEETEELAIYARRTQLTLNSLAQGAWALLLSRYSGETDVVFGATVSGRAMALDGVEKMIGLFINTLPVRVLIDERANPADWLRRLQQEQVEQRQYEFSGLREIRAWSELGPGMRLFETVFVFENYPVDESLTRRIEGGGSFEISEVSSVEPTNYDLTVVAVPGRRFRLEIGYDKNRYDGPVVNRMLGHLGVLTKRIATGQSQCLRDLQMLTDSEQQQIIVESRATADFPLHLCVHDLFELQARQSPDCTAAVCNGEHLTYREMDRRANGLADCLRRQGVGPETMVGVSFQRSIAMVTALIAVAKTGGAYVPLDPAYPLERLLYMVDDASARLIITANNLTRLFSRLALKTVRLDEGSEAIVTDTRQPARGCPIPDNAVYVVFTSGSTGNPKGVVVSHRALVNECSAFARHHGLKPGERLLQFASVGFDVAAEEVFAPLISGATVVLGPVDAVVSILELLSLCDREQLTVLNLPSTYWHEWVDEYSRGRHHIPSSLRLVVVGNEKVFLESLVRWQRFAEGRIEWKNAYGPTEATITTTIYRADRTERLLQSVPIGKPIWNAEVYLLDRQMRPVPMGVVGELHIGGAGLARCYLNQPDLTAEHFAPNAFGRGPGERVYRTGDLAGYLADGNIEFVGRMDDQVKVRGYRIELGEIEAALNAIQTVKEGAVSVKEAIGGDRRLVAYVAFSDGAQTDVAAVRDSLKQRLPEFMVPTAFVVLDGLPKTATGKIDRRALPAPELRRSEPRGPSPPRTEVERLLVKIWRDVLGVEPAIDDDFFNLGGDSILSLQIVGMAGQSGIKLTPKQVFQHPTIRELAALAETGRPIEADQARVSGNVMLTPIQRWFFEQEISDRNLYGHVIALDPGTAVDPCVWKLVVEKVVDHHDALRMRFSQKDGAWEQRNAESEEAGLFTLADFSASGPGEEAALAWAARDIQGRLDIVKGPLIRVALIDLGSAAKRLLIAMHHLVSDAVSWRLLLQDLCSSYQQLSRGDQLTLPAKTTSFRRWAEGLKQFAQSEEIAREAKYWIDQLSKAVKRQSSRVAQTGDGPSLMRRLSVELGEAQTRAVFKEILAVYRINIEELLLSTLVEAYSEWSGEPTLVVDVEGHGREQILEGVDLSRTAGWFTTIFPLVLEKREPEGIDETVRRTKEQIRQVPARGIGYGLLRYLTDRGDLQAEIRALPSAEVSFNYLGAIDRVFAGAGEYRVVELAAERATLPWGRQYVIEVNAMTKNGKLVVDWSYDETRCGARAMEDLAQKYLDRLGKVVDHCRSSDIGALTPSDFPEIDLSQEELEDLISEISAVMD